MKEIKYIFLLGLTLMPGSCQKEEIMMYQQRAGAYFSTRSMAYLVYLKIRVSIFGTLAFAGGYYRQSGGLSAGVYATLPDFPTWTTAEEDQYKIGQGYVGGR